MTNAEALNIIRNTAWLGGEHQEQVAQAVDVITEALEKADKYKWHDLRKNPDDLPLRGISAESDEVIVYDGSYYYIAEYIFPYGEWRETTEYMIIPNEKVIAWREIEPFEEGEE